MGKTYYIVLLASMLEFLCQVPITTTFPLRLSPEMTEHTTSGKAAAGLKDTKLDRAISIPATN